MSNPNFIDLSEAELDALIERLRQAADGTGSLDAKDINLLIQALKSLATLQMTLQSKDVTLAKLKKLLGMVSSSEKLKDVLRSGNAKNPASGEDKQNENNDVSDENSTVGTVPQEPVPGHGKHPKAKFKKKTTVFHEELSHQKGDVCPECKKGKLYKFEPSEFLRITANSPLSVTAHVSKRLRCNLCQHVIQATLPQEVIDDGGVTGRYGYSVKSSVAVLKYDTGFPFHRQGQWYKSHGVDLSPSTMWDLSEQVANAANPVYKELLKDVANAKLYYVDDTSNKILNIGAAIKKSRGSNVEKERNGVHTSLVLAKLGSSAEVVLFKTGIHHVGEVMDELLQNRAPEAGSFIQMSDASYCNSVLDVRGIVAKCNAHARRQFVDIRALFPEETQFVIELYAKVYEHEKFTRDEHHEPKKRLEHHQTHSLPLMESLFVWAKDKLGSKSVEPNSILGKAVQYLLNHQAGLLAFCTVLGAPIDNNPAERKIKTIILHRKNALFYKEQIGADVSDILMSTIGTAKMASLNQTEYLTLLQREAKEVQANPRKYLPYLASMQSI